MKFPAFRRYIQNKNLHEPHSLHDRNLVIDAQCFFKNSYKDSGCQYVLGPDCDRYADYLIGKLAPFLDCNIKCYVIFKGTSKDDLEKVQANHQITIDDRKNIEFNLNNPTYFDPLLVDDVQKQVLEEMDIKYFCCEHDSMEAIVGVARALKCPVLTDSVEYCLFKVSCIVPNSVVYNETNKTIECTMYEHHKYQALFGVFIKTPILLTVLSPNKDFLSQMPELFQCAENNDILPVISWVKRLPKDFDVSKIFKDENTRKSFVELYVKMKSLFLYPSNNLAVNYFRREKPYGLFKDDKKWFAKGISNGRIGLPYVDIKRRGLLSGSKVVNDIYKPDAILAADKIIAYNHKLLTNSRKTTLNFIGRKNTSSTIWAIETDWSSEINNRELFKPNVSVKENKKVYLDFFKGNNPKHDLINIFLSHKKVPQSCWILVIALVYYIDNVNEDFIDAAYFIILSYVLLGPVSETLHQFEEKGESNENDTLYDDARKIYDGIKFLFHKVDLKHEYNTSILHSLAEFLHCLQHMNYLNKICGQENRGYLVPSTIYHDTYNATFIYNALIFMKNKDKLMTYLEEHFKDSAFITFYKDIIFGLESCRHPTQKMLRDVDCLMMQFFTVREMEDIDLE